MADVVAHFKVMRIFERRSFGGEGDIQKCFGNILGDENRPYYKRSNEVQARRPECDRAGLASALK
jgi:hypothetical protein